MIPLVITSCGFILVAFKGVKRKKYALSVSSLTAGACSINFWRNPINGVRQKIDIICARGCFVVYVCEACKNKQINGINLSLLTTILGLYKGSVKIHPHQSWKIFHGLFHICAASGQMLVIKHVPTAIR